MSAEYVQVKVRLRPDLYSVVKSCAQDSGRSVSEEVSRAVEACIQKQAIEGRLDRIEGMLMAMQPRPRPSYENSHAVPGWTAYPLANSIAGIPWIDHGLT